jgi:hypothetical protein
LNKYKQKYITEKKEKEESGRQLEYCALLTKLRRARQDEDTSLKRCSGVVYGVLVSRAAAVVSRDNSLGAL